MQTLDIPFREAHHITGSIVALAEKKRINLNKLQLSDLQSAEPRITEDLFDVLDPARSAKSRRSLGGTSPSNVRREAKRWIKRLEKDGVSR
mgnify:FL=1